MRPRSRPAGLATTGLATMAWLAGGIVASPFVGAAAGAARPVVAQNGGAVGASPTPAGRPSPRVAPTADRPLSPSTEPVPDRGTDSPANAASPSSGPSGEKPGKGESAASSSPRLGTVPDLDKLRAEYDRIREELFKARVRNQKVAEGVYPSRMDLRLRWKGGPDFVIGKARFSLDGAELWDSADRAQTDDLIQVAARSVKPGPHALGVHLEIRPKTEAKGGTKTGANKLGYTSEHTFAIVVAETGITHLLLTGDEDGDPPEYEPELELEIEIDK